MIAVLLAALVVLASGLEVAVFARANPHVVVGRRDGERMDARDFFLVGDALAVQVEEVEPGLSDG